MGTHPSPGSVLENICEHTEPGFNTWTSSGLPQNSLDVDSMERAVPSPGITIPTIPALHSWLCAAPTSLSSPGQLRSLPGEVPELDTTAGLPHVPQGCSPALPCAASTALRFLGSGSRCWGAQEGAQDAAQSSSCGLWPARAGQTQLGSLHTRFPLGLSLGKAARLGLTALSCPAGRQRGGTALGICQAVTKNQPRAQKAAWFSWWEETIPQKESHR